jgi:RimJ/RimL family protein N-acetyltransferase
VDSLETPRLLLRPFAPEDAALVHAVYSDPAVMRYVATGPMADIALTRRLLEDYDAHQRRHGFSFWAVIERSSGTLIGDSGLYQTPAGEIELGYTLGASWWGRGYATEAAGRWLAVAFDELGLDEVIALAEPANLPSLHVLEKLGMQPAGERIAFGRPHAVFRRQRPRRASIPSRIRWRPNTKESRASS